MQKIKYNKNKNHFTIINSNSTIEVLKPLTSKLKQLIKLNNKYGQTILPNPINIKNQLYYSTIYKIED